MDTDLGDGLSYDHFTHWSVIALQDYCSQRGFPRSGTRAELAALAYTAYRTNAPLQPSAAEKVKQAKESYKQKLILPCGTKIEDPLTTTSSWEGEGTAVSKWPRITHGDIIHYFNNKQGVDAKETLNKYKEGKAFSYFSSNYVKEILFKKIRDKNLCILKTCVTRSGSVNEPPHRAWVCTSLPDGDIIRAYCTCTAGLHESCNHLAGLLFRVEAAFTAGLLDNADVTCTSLPSTWILPAAKTTVVLGEVFHFNFVQPCAGKTKTRPLVSDERRNFSPFDDDSEDTLRRDNLMQRLSISKPKSAVSLMWLAEKNVDFKRSDQDRQAEKKDPDPVAMYLEDYILGKTVHRSDSVRAKVALVKENMPRVTDAEVEYISRLTVKQGDDDRWIRARRGRITASIFGKVLSRNVTLHDPASTRSKDPGPMLVEIMGYNPLNPEMPALKYGREKEVLARPAYIKHQTGVGHVNMRIDLAGLYVSKEHIFLGASPDLLVTCDCCGKGLGEIKCPKTLEVSDCITTSAPNFLQDIDGTLHLKRTHTYYAQVQGQMAILGRDWCDFVVYCPNDIWVERVTFDRAYWIRLCGNLQEFYWEYVVPEILTHEHRPAEQVKAVQMKYKRSTYLARKAADHAHYVDSESDAAQAICTVAYNVVIGEE